MGILGNKIFWIIGGAIILGAFANYFYTISPSNQLRECIKIVEEGQEGGKKVLFESGLPNAEEHIKMLEDVREEQIERCHRLFGN